MTLRQTALLYIYQDKEISIREADKIARLYGNKSGDKLKKYYNKFVRTANRVGVEGQEIKWFIEDLEAIIPFLSKENKQRVEVEKRTISAKLYD